MYRSRSDVMSFLQTLMLRGLLGRGNFTFSYRMDFGLQVGNGFPGVDVIGSFLLHPTLF